MGIFRSSTLPSCLRYFVNVHSSTSPCHSVCPSIHLSVCPAVHLSVFLFTLCEFSPTRNDYLGDDRYRIVAPIFERCMVECSRAEGVGAILIHSRIRMAVYGDLKKRDFQRRECLDFSIHIWCCDFVQTIIRLSLNLKHSQLLRCGPKY